MLFKSSTVSWHRNAVAIFLLISLLRPLQAHDETAQFREATMTVDGYELHYRIGGNGPVLLMLHGFTLTGEQWLPFAEAFADSYTVVLADLPGHGGSSPQPDAFSFEKAGNLMLGLLDKLDAQQAHGIGHSGGGITLLNMAVKQPNRLQALVLVEARTFLGRRSEK